MSENPLDPIHDLLVRAEPATGGEWEANALTVRASNGVDVATVHNPDDRLAIAVLPELYVACERMLRALAFALANTDEPVVEAGIILRLAGEVEHG